MAVLKSIFIPLSKEGGTRRGGDYHWYFSAPLTYLKVCSLDKNDRENKQMQRVAYADHEALIFFLSRSLHFCRQDVGTCTLCTMSHPANKLA